jgi:hypothetical protein
MHRQENPAQQRTGLCKHSVCHQCRLPLIPFSPVTNSAYRVLAHSTAEQRTLFLDPNELRHNHNYIFPYIAAQGIQYFFKCFISPIFNQVGKLRTSSHLQLRPGQDKAKQSDTYNNTELHME